MSTFAELLAALPEREQRFVEAFLLEPNRTKAAIAADYSEKTADAQGCRLLKKIRVAEAIEAARAERSQRTNIDADWLLKRLAAEADADVADLFDDTGNLLPVRQWPEIWRKGLVAGVDIVVERKKGKEGKPDELTSAVAKVKLVDRGRRLELIGRHVNVQAFKDRISVPLEGDPAEVARAIAAELPR